MRPTSNWRSTRPQGQSENEQLIAGPRRLPVGLRQIHVNQHNRLRTAFRQRALHIGTVVMVTTIFGKLAGRMVRDFGWWQFLVLSGVCAWLSTPVDAQQNSFQPYNNVPANKIEIEKQ